MGTVPHDVYHNMLEQIEFQIALKEQELKDLNEEYNDLFNEANHAYPMQECAA